MANFTPSRMYIKQKVDVRLTKSVVEVFFEKTVFALMSDFMGGKNRRKHYHRH